MRSRICHMRLLTVVLSMLFTSAFYAHAEQEDLSQQILKPGMKIVKSTPLVSQPLRSLAAAQIETALPSAALLLQDHLLAIPKTIKGNETGGLDASIVQNGTIGNYMPSPTANFEGVNNVNGVLPPDTQGDIGFDQPANKKYYVQWVNLSYQIWDVTNPASPISLVGPVAGNTLWSGTGTLCASHNDGDPLTRFDNLSKRWVMSQFALSFPNDFHQCIAVSQTADPTGSWYLYDFQTSTTVMNDYGKLGVWPDGYYMSFNQFGGVSPYPWEGAGVAVFERDKMLAGQPANMIYIDVGAANMNYGGMLPSDLDGTPPPAGSPNYFAEWDDSTSSLGDLQDTIRIWKFHTDWTTPANTTFGLNSSYDPDLKIATANVNPDMCGGAACIPQPGTAQKLDAISDRLMYRLQYRNFGAYQTLVGNHTVDADGADKAGVHWFELRDSGSDFAMHQQGVYAPDADNRWMASAAMDVSGDIALGYSVASAATYPSIRYTGRLAADPAGTLPQGETTLIAGSGSQTSSAARWGDYSMMAVDPVDGCTFWYTQEYVQTTGSANWQTRIGSFRFPSCSAGPTGALSGTVTTGGSTPVSGATVEVSGGITTVTDGSGHYSISLASGSYDVTVSKYGYVTSTTSGVVVNAPATTTQNFNLNAATYYTISGSVTDAVASWPLYARIDITGYPGGPVFTDPVTGNYSVQLVNGSYTFSVTAMSGGYTPHTQTYTFSSSAGLNLQLAVDATSCTAPGYHSVSGTTFLTDGFDTSTAPAFSSSWGVADLSGTAGNWATSAATVHPSGYPPHSAPNLAYFNSWTAGVGNSTRLYRTGGIDLSGQATGEVSFWMYHDTGYSTAIDTVQVQVSTDSGVSWNSVGAAIPRYNGTTGWAKHTVNINSYTGSGNTEVRIGFLANSAYGNDIHIDDVMVSNVTQCLPLASGGLVIGAVRDANTGSLISYATVKDAGNNPATMIDSSADHASPARMYVIGLSATGDTTLTATAPPYQTGHATPGVIPGATVQQDILLAAGELSANPTSLSFTVTKDSPTGTNPLDLINNGGASADYKIFALPGVYTPSIATGPFAEHTRHIGPKNLNDRNSSKLRMDFTPTGITPLAAGDVSSSFDTGLSTPWGIGYNTNANDLWVSNIDDKMAHRFTTLGVNSGETIDISGWAASTWGADMAYNPLTNRLWQVNVGGDNCIHELDPVAKTSTGSEICPPFGTSERGLAFDPLTNTYYSGSWNDGIINHFAPDGTLLDSASVGLDISGLAINPVTGHLFVMTNAATTSDTSKYDVYLLDTKSSYANLGGFNIKVGGVNAFADYAQSGLEMDCNGNLWAVNQSAKKVYVAPSGETGVCNWQADWLSATPSSGSVPAVGTAHLSAGVDATALSEGVHNGYLAVVNSSPYGSVYVPVTLTVMSKLTVTKSGFGSGTVTSTPGGISCGSVCTEQYQPNSVVSLSAAAATSSTFSGWSGDPDCADGSVTMDTSKSCNAIFNITPVRVPGQYATIQEAYDGLLNNGSIQTLIQAYPENVHFNRAINATLNGGYSPDWTAATGMTTIEGSLSIEKGSAVISNLVIK